jgi:uncharacterized protein YkwD
VALVWAPPGSARNVPRPTARRHRTHRRHLAAEPCANASAPATTAPAAAERAAVVCLINQQRSSRGLPALLASALLDRSAQGWTAQMVATGDFTHGSDFAARISAVGFVWSSAGENIATGFPTPQDVVDAWMGSKGHCQNILDPSYADVGTGISPHPVGRLASGPSTWAQDFALPRGMPAPSGNWAPEQGCPY